MKAQQLKNSILQYAMQGKLVEQDPTDEPASVLLERIKEEKEQLIKDKVIKREKALPPITEDEIPFEIPDTWEWVRLNSICLKINDGAHHTPNYTSKGIPFLSVKDISNRKLDFSNTKFISREEHEKLYQRCNPEYGDVLITKVGTTGVPVIVDTHQQFSLFVSVALLKFNQDLVFNKYLFYLIDSPVVYEQSKSNTRGVGNKNLVVKAIKGFVIPIPPLMEQKRIVKKIEELMEKVDEYDVLEQEITTLNNAFPTDMEKSILQYAMQGKLVEQDPNDEPASVLLERIKEEKEQLIQDKVIKREKALPPINEDEIPFEIPESWEWVRLKDLSSKVHYGYTTSASDRGNAKLIRITDIQNNKVEWDTVPYCEISENNLSKYELEPRDVLIARTGGTIGKSYLIKEVDEISVFASYLIRLKPLENIDANYLKICIETPLYWNQLENMSMGTGQPNVNATNLKKLTFPLPPLTEQKRIVDKIEEMLRLTNRMKNTLNPK